MRPTIAFLMIELNSLIFIIGKYCMQVWPFGLLSTIDTNLALYGIQYVDTLVSCQLGAHTYDIVLYIHVHTVMCIPDFTFPVI